MPILLENPHHSWWKNLRAQIDDQKDCFHPCAQENKFVLHSSHVCLEQERSPTFQNTFPSEHMKHSRESKLTQ